MVKFYLSLFSKIAFSLSALFIIGMLSTGYLFISNQNTNAQKEKRELVSASVKILGQGSVDAIISGDFELLERWLQVITINDIYAYGYIADSDSRILVHTDSKMIGTLIQDTNATLYYKNKEIKELEYLVYLDGKIFASAHLAYYSRDDIFAIFRQEGFIVILASIVFFLILMLWATLVIIRHYTTPIVELTKAVSEFSFDNNKKMKNKKLSKRRDEVGLLSKKFQLMTTSLNKAYKTLQENEHHLQQEVEKRTQDLVDKNELLVQMQDQLIESEKMAALGNLVAGIAHEVNTPLGVAITSASVFRHHVLKLQEMIQAKTLSEEDLENFFSTIKETDKILAKNLERAALLIKQFKKISIDQSSEEIRDFELNEYLKEVLFTFKNELKNRNIIIEIDSKSDDDIEMHSYPGAISQVIINMLQNTLLHAFGKDDKGTIVISMHQKEESVEMIFCDDGKGVDALVIDTIFEPFVTTKRNQGGTGLGLHIIYNLVTQKLGGTIILERENKIGTCFIMKIPCFLKKI